MAAKFIFDFDSVTSIVADAVGQPGERTFVLQARQGRQMASLIMEKQQVAALAASVLQLLEELEQEHPELPPTDALGKGALRLIEPITPAFRVGQMGLGYDADQDLVVLVAQGLPAADAGEEVDEVKLPRARFFATRSQMRALSEHALDVVAAGRPECPLCGQPIDPDGHFCPRTNGHAHPLLM